MPNRFQSAFDGLASLGAGDEPGVRPVILRVLADLFVTRAHHAPVEIAQFEEIACRLVDKADAETCEIVARKLIAHEGAPQRVLEALARVSAGAAIVVLGSNRSVSAHRLAAAAAWGPVDLAAAVAGRADLEPPLVAALSMRPEPAIVLALASNPKAPLSRADLKALAARAREDAALAKAVLARAEPADCAALFLHADATQRLAILTALKREQLGVRSAAQPQSVADPAFLTRLEQAAFAADRPRIALLLAEIFDIRLLAARRIAEDQGGEPLVVALAALSLDAPLMERALIFLEPGQGDSMARFERLRMLAFDLRPALARRLIDACTGRVAPTGGAHRPLVDPSAAPAPGRPAATAARGETRPADRAADRARGAGGA
ncbi:MAG: DUF2336 domain-containing protein [Rhizobiales bacterium]|nr:DUF2336 domain-containing protein [Hyphomicrobiales bacterium]